MPDRWKGATESRTRATALVLSTFESIRRDVQQMLLAPSLDIDYDIIAAYAALFAETVAFAKAISNSNPGYWDKDLGADTADDIARAKHALYLLKMAYEPAQVTSNAKMER